METSTNYSKTADVRRADKSENITLFRNVYLWMTMALFITGATALTVSDSPTLLNAIFGSKVAFFGLIIAELALVIILSSFIFRMSFLTATLMFIAYSILNGATLASIFLLYTASSIASTFFVTAGTFGAMALFGYFTKRDLSGIGNTRAGLPQDDRGRQQDGHHGRSRPAGQVPRPRGGPWAGTV